MLGGSSSNKPREMDITDTDEWMLFKSLVSLPQNFSIDEWNVVDHEVREFLKMKADLTAKVKTDVCRPKNTSGIS